MLSQLQVHFCEYKDGHDMSGEGGVNSKAKRVGYNVSNLIMYLLLYVLLTSLAEFIYVLAILLTPN